MRIRARESPALAEQEFLSSTSHEVCELWSGSEIIRLHDFVDQARVQYLFTVRSSRDFLQQQAVGGREDAFEKSPSVKIMSGPEARSAGLLSARGGLSMEHELRMSPPCMALNVRGCIIGGRELWLWSAAAVTLQASAVAIAATITYWAKLERKGHPVPEFAFPIYAVGTLLNTCGILFCGRLIESSTLEAEYAWVEEDYQEITNVMQLQLGCSVGPHWFPKCLVFLDPNERTLRISRRHRNGRKYVMLLTIHLIVTD